MVDSHRPAALSMLNALVPALAWLAFIATAAWVATSWYWRVAGPRVERAVPMPIVDPSVAAAETSSRHLFGRASVDIVSGAPVSGFFAGRYKVLGVAAAARGEGGFAVIQADGEPATSVIEGQALVPGVVVSRILPTGVELSRGGVREILPLTRTEAATGVSPGVMPAPVAPAQASSNSANGAAPVPGQVSPNMPVTQPGLPSPAPASRNGSNVPAPAGSALPSSAE